MIEFRQVKLVAPKVHQDELKALIALRNQIRLLTKQYDVGCERVLRKLLDGASIEPGTHHAEIEETLAGCTRVDRLQIY